MGDDSAIAIVAHEAPDAARRPAAGLAGARSADPGAEPPDPHEPPDAAPAAGLAEPPDPHEAPDAAPAAGLAEPPDPHQAPDAAGRPAAGLASARSADPGAEPPDPHQAPEAPAGPSLSPSRAGDFLTCPLLYRFRVIDRLPEPPSPAAVRGTLVHSVLERLFDAPAVDRTPAAARALVDPEWARLREAEPELAGLFGDDGQHGAWLDEVMQMLDRYFTLEDPRRIEPAHRELCVEAELASGLRLRGYVDRLDVAPDGRMRIVDYKTGGAPPEEFEARALFQMRFYALALWRSLGQVPKLLQLIYLGNGEIVRYEPDEADLLATERKIEALWLAIERARVNQDWRPRPGRICDWCAHRAICPAFGGTPPPIPQAPVRPEDIPEPRDGTSPV